MALAVGLLPREMPVALVCVHLLTSGCSCALEKGLLQIIVRALAEVCVQLFDVFRFLPSALPPSPLGDVQKRW